MARSASTPEQWLRTFEAAVRARDFTAGRALFADDAVAFGTWARAVAGLDNIIREQWHNVWPRIRDFRFEPDARVRTSGDSAWIAGGWLTEVTGPDGRPFTRPGRSTFVLGRPGRCGSTTSSSRRLAWTRRGSLADGRRRGGGGAHRLRLAGVGRAHGQRGGARVLPPPGRRRCGGAHHGCHWRAAACAGQGLRRRT